MGCLNLYDTINIRGRKYKVVRLDSSVTRCDHCPFNNEELCNMKMNIAINNTVTFPKPCRILLGGGRLELVSSLNSSILNKWKGVVNGG